MASIRKNNNGTYKLTVSNGYSNGKQLRKYKTITPPDDLTEKQLRKYLDREAFLFEEEIKGCDKDYDENLTFRALTRRFLTAEKNSLADTTYSKYESIIRLSLNPYFGDMKLCEISTQRIQSYIDELCRRKEHFNGRPGKLKPSSVAKYFIVLRSIFSFAQRQKYIVTSPISSKSIITPKIAETEIITYTPDEISVMLKAVQNEQPKYRMFLILAISTGCRRGEIVAFKWSDFDFDNKILTVSRNNCIVKYGYKTKSTKSYKIRQVPLTDFCINELKLYRAEQNKLIDAVGDGWYDEDWVLTQEDGSAMYPSTPGNWLNKFLKKNHLPHKQLHAIRHTSATLLLTQGVDIKAVSEILGHSNISTTNRYVHALTSEKEKAANCIDNFLASVTKPKEDND